MSDEKCPGCHNPFAEDDITGDLRNPWLDGDITNRRWHLSCHQDAYLSDIRRERGPGRLAGPNDLQYDKK